MGKKNETVVEVAASGSVEPVAPVPAKEEGSLINEIARLHLETKELETKVGGLESLLEKRVAEVSSLEKQNDKMKESLRALTSELDLLKTTASAPAIAASFEGSDYVVEKCERLRDLIHLWRQQYVRDDTVIAILKKS